MERDQIIRNIQELDPSYSEGDEYDLTDDLSLAMNKRTRSILKLASVAIVEEDFATMKFLRSLELSNEDLRGVTSEVFSELSSILEYLDSEIAITVVTPEGVAGTLSSSLEQVPDVTQGLKSTHKITMFVCSAQDLARYYVHMGKLFVDEMIAKELDSTSPGPETEKIVEELSTQGAIFFPHRKPLQRSNKHPYSEAVLNIAERQFMVVTEPIVNLQSLSEATKQNLSDFSADEAWDLKREILKMKIRHEILHALGVGKMFPSFLQEGIVQKYTVESSSSLDRFPGLKTWAYISNVDVVNFLEPVLKEHAQLDSSSIKDLFMLGSWEQYDKLYAFLVMEYGVNAATKMLDNDSTEGEVYHAILKNVQIKRETMD